MGGGTWRSPLVRALFGPVMVHTNRYICVRPGRWPLRSRTTRTADSRSSGGIGIAGSPSCGVQTTLDLPAAMDVLCRCRLANLDRRMNNEQVIGAHTRPGQGLFVTVLQQQVAKRGVAVRFDEYDFASRSKPWPPHRSRKQSP